MEYEHPTQCPKGGEDFALVCANQAAAPALVAALEELSDWMRARTGPADGTLAMLTRAHEALRQARGE